LTCHYKSSHNTVLSRFFIARGYKRRIINRGYERAALQKRDDLLSGKNKRKKDDLFTFPITYNNFNRKLLSRVKANYKKLCQDPEIGKAFPPRFTPSFRIGKRLRHTVVNTHIQEDDSSIVRGTFPCGRRRCVNCPYTNPDKYICGPSGYTTPSDSFTCISTDVLYVISCERCGDIYVGETGNRLADRMTNHRYDINKRLRNPSAPANSKVASHFSENGHSLEDFKVAVIRRIPNIHRRLAEEQRLIQRLGAYKAEGMNIEYYHLRNSN